MIDRRGFCKKALLIAGGLAIPISALEIFDPKNLLAEKDDQGKVRWVFLVDTYNCVGCGLFRRLMLSVFASLYTRVITGLPVKDCTSGYKCFRRSTIEAIDLDTVGSDGYSFQIEMNYRCMEKGLKIVEVPIIFIDRHAGSSKMSKKIVREAILLVWKLKLGTLMRRLLGKG